MPQLGKEQEIFVDPFYLTPLFNLSNPSFSHPMVLDAGIWSKAQPELRVGDRSPPLGRELEFWFWLSSSPPFSGGPGENPVTPGHLQVAGDVFKANCFSLSLPDSQTSCLFPLLLSQPGLFFSL